MTSERIFAEAIRTINKDEMVVLRDVHHFPVYGQDIISPYMMVCVCHSGSARVLYDMEEVVFSPNEVAVIMPHHILHPIESSDDYHVTILVHSPALCEELKTKRLTHDYHKFHRRPSCLLTDEEMAQYMQAIDLLEHICQSSTQRYPLRHEMLIELTNVMAEMHNAYRREMDEKAAKDNRNYSLFNDFCDLLATHYREEHEYHRADTESVPCTTTLTAKMAPYIKQKGAFFVMWQSILAETRHGCGRKTTWHRNCTIDGVRATIVCRRQTKPNNNIKHIQL